ncbi:MAG: hypothetical protein JJV93_01470 [Alphaproteobacteria bacterium]|nr:hypothetical protein [Alphaproteobacteria bacterium]
MRKNFSYSLLQTSPVYPPPAQFLDLSLPFSPPHKNTTQSIIENKILNSRDMMIIL